MTAIDLIPLILVALAMPWALLSKARWPRVALAIGLLSLQVLMLGRMFLVYRAAMAQVTQSVGPVREVAAAMQVLRDLQLPAALTVLIAGVGLMLLAAIRRRSQAG